jgi:hypothetical protein
MEMMKRVEVEARLYEFGKNGCSSKKFYYGVLTVGTGTGQKRHNGMGRYDME